MKDGGTALIGWQTLLADLALILFMVTAAAMAAGAGRAARPAMHADRPASEPLAVWRAGGSLTLARWLAMEQPDGRQQLTITAHYLPGGQARALAMVQALIDRAGTIGRTARVIVAPAAVDETLAGLAYDRPPQPGTAQGLLDPPGIPSARTPP